MTYENEKRTNRFTVSFTDSEMALIDKSRKEETRNNFVRRGALGLADDTAKNEITQKLYRNQIDVLTSCNLSITLEVTDIYLDHNIALMSMPGDCSGWACKYYYIVYNIDTDNYTGIHGWNKGEDPPKSIFDGLLDKDGNNSVNVFWSLYYNDDDSIEPADIFDTETLAVYRKRVSTSNDFIDVTFDTLADAMMALQNLVNTK